MPLSRFKEISTLDRPGTAKACRQGTIQRAGGSGSSAGSQNASSSTRNARTMADDVTARLAALRRRWEATGDLNALAGALIFCQLQLPEWLFKGLMQNLEQQLKNPDAIRFLAVRHAHDVLGKTMDESYDWASENIDDPAARGGRDTMMKSYQKIRSQVGEIDRIRKRARARRRRS